MKCRMALTGECHYFRPRLLGEQHAHAQPEQPKPLPRTRNDPMVERMFVVSTLGDLLSIPRP